MLPDAHKDLILANLPGLAYRSAPEAPWPLSFVSPGVRSICSYSAEDFVSNRVTWGSIVHPEDCSRLEEEISKASEEKRPFECTYRIQDPEYGEKWVLERGEAVFDAQGEPEALVGFIVDITEQKMIEKQLRRSERHYRAAVELNPQVPWTATPDGTVEEVGPQWVNYVGETFNREIGPHWVRALHPDDRERVSSLWMWSIKTGCPFDTRYRLKLRDESFRWFRARSAPRLNAAGEIVRWYGTLEDINAQVAAEAELKEAEKRYSLAAQATGDIIWDWDPDTGIIRRICPETSKLCYDGPEFESSPQWWENWVHPEDLQRVRDGLEQLVQGEEDQWFDEYRLRRTDGTYAHIIDRAFVTRDDSNRITRLVGAMQDISERVAAEEKLRQLQTDLIHVARLTAMGTMASTIAHEINQPLTAAANYLTASRRMVKSLTGEKKDFVETGLKGAEGQIIRAGEIIRRVRDMIARKGDVREKITLSEMASTVVKLMAASGACRGVSIRINVPAAADIVEVDSIQIEQVLLNLLRNASDAMTGDPRAEIELSATEAGQFVQVQVRDRGRGIPVEIMETMFTTFAESTTGGLGLGLSITRTIVEAHGGKIWAKNEEEGASIFFTLPRPGSDQVPSTRLKESVSL